MYGMLSLLTGSLSAASRTRRPAGPAPSRTPSPRSAPVARRPARPARRAQPGRSRSPRRGSRPSRAATAAPAGLTRPALLPAPHRPTGSASVARQVGPILRLLYAPSHRSRCRRATSVGRLLRGEPAAAGPRPSLMRRTFTGGLPVVVLAVVALSGGCATGAGTGSAAGATAAGVSGRAQPSSCQPSSGSTTITVTEADNGRIVCARISQRIEVYLHGTLANPWSPVTATGAQLRPAPSGKLSLQVGVTGAVFSVVAAGQTDILSSRAMCNPPSSGSACPTKTTFRLTVSAGG